MTNAKRDENNVTTMLWVSNVDSVTPVPIKVNPVTWRIIAEVSWSTDVNFKVSAADTTTGYWEDKIVAWTGITINKLNPWANEQLEITAPSWTWDVVWPASAVDSNLAVFDWITGKLLKDWLPWNTTTSPKFLTSLWDWVNATAPYWDIIPAVWNIVYYLSDVASDVATYYKQTVEPVTASTFIASWLTAWTTLIGNLITEPWKPWVNFLPAWQYDLELIVAETAGNRPMIVYWEVWETDSAWVDIAKIWTYTSSSTISTKSNYRLDFVLTAPYLLTDTDSRICTRIYATWEATWTNATLTFYFGWADNSRMTLPFSVVSANTFVPYSWAINNVDLWTNTIVANNLSWTNTWDQTQSTIPVATSWSPTSVTNIQDFYNYSWSAWAVSWFWITDNLDWTYNIADWEVIIRNAANPTAPMTTYQVTWVTWVIATDWAVTYAYVNYNSWTPVIVTNGAIWDFNCQDKCVLYEIARDWNIIVYKDLTQENIDANRKQRTKDIQSQAFTYIDWGKITETWTRNIAVSQLDWWFWYAPATWSAIDTSITWSFITYYTTDSWTTWTSITGQTQINNTQYNDITSWLVSLSNNKFWVHYIYEAINGNDVLIDVLWQWDYNTIEDALAAPKPAIIPALAQIWVYLWRIIIQKNATTFSEITDAFKTSEVSWTATSHAWLTNLAWTGSWHTWTADTLAWFNSTWVASEYTLSWTGTVIPTTTSPTITDPKIVTTINAQTGTTYTLVLTDASKLVTLSNAAAIALTVPTNASVAFPIWTQVDITQQGAGAVTISGAWTTLNSKWAALTTNWQFVWATLVKIGTDEWNVYWDLI